MIISVGHRPLLGYLQGNISSFGAWQAATGSDAKSLSVNPLFISAANAHLRPASPLNALATTIGGITTDIDGETRTVAPDMGADS